MPFLAIRVMQVNQGVSRGVVDLREFAFSHIDSVVVAFVEGRVLDVEVTLLGAFVLSRLLFVDEEPSLVMLISLTSLLAATVTEEKKTRCIQRTQASPYL